jgi:Low molecular weight phosphotyrosine protein phosphatase
MHAMNRRLLLIGLPAIALAGAAKPVPRILFICEFGTAKSAIAREIFRRRARDRGIKVTAFSRGLKGIEDHVSPPLRQALAAEKLDTRRDGFAKLAPRDLRAADMIVTFVPVPENQQWRELRDWTALPSVNDAWPAARADLIQRIDALLDEIAKR